MSIKKISIKNAQNTTDTYNIGASAENVKINYDANGNMITSEDSTTAASTSETVAKAISDLKTAAGNISKKAPINHASTSTDYGVASSTNYGHVKTGTGITNSSGAISVTYGSTAGTACQGDDSRLSDARNTKQALTFNNGGSGVASGTTFNGSTATTVSYNTIGAAPTSHASTSTTYGIGTGSNYGHVKLTDTYNVTSPTASSNGASTGIAASAYALQKAYSELNSKLNKSSVQFVDITADFNSGTFSSNLDKYSPGNFIKKTYNGTTYVAVLADYNTFYNPGRNDYANSNQNHWTAIVMGFTPGQMNTTDTTNGAMTGSAMNTWLKGECTTAVKGAFGVNHLIAHSCLLSTGNNGSFSWAWEDGYYTMLMSEAQIYGCNVWGIQGWNTGEASKHLTIFKEKSFMEVLGRNYGQSNNNFNSYSAWLRDIGSLNPGALFCLARCNGYAYDNSASSSHGRFPLIMLK